MLWRLQQMRVHGCIFCREWDGKTAHLNVLMLTRIIIVSYIAVQVPRTIIATLGHLKTHFKVTSLLRVSMKQVTTGEDGLVHQ
jgi:hypothetical protein